METLSPYYRQLVGVNSDCTIASVAFGLENRRVTLALEFVGAVPRRSAEDMIQARSCR